MSLTISVVLPTLNEANSLPLLIPRISKSLENIDHEVIVVDDNSPDKTGEIAESMATKFPVRVIVRKNERGLSSAVVRGMESAKGEWICVMDSDGSHPPEIIPKLFEAAIHSNREMAVGSRYLQGGSVEDWPFFRKMISVGATFLARPLTNVRDPMSGFFVVKKNQIPFSKVKPLGYKILLELLVKGDLATVEIPYKFINRKVGKSNLGIKQYIEYVRHLSSLYTWKAQRGNV